MFLQIRRFVQLSEPIWGLEALVFYDQKNWLCGKYWIHTSSYISLVFQPKITFELLATKFLDEIAIVRIVLRSASAVVQQDLRQLFTPHLGPHDPRSSPRGGAADKQNIPKYNIS